MAAGAVSLKYLTKHEEVRKGADQANNLILPRIVAISKQYRVISVPVRSPVSGRIPFSRLTSESGRE